MTALATSWFGSPRQSSGASGLAEALVALLAKAHSHARENATDWRSLARAYIQEIGEECSEDGWDGYAGRAITTETIEQALFFIDMFPYASPAPEIAPDPDGEIAFSWDFGPGRLFTATIAASGAVSFAGLLGNGEKVHGVESFEGKIPQSILESLRILSTASDQ